LQDDSPLETKRQVFGYSSLLFAVYSAMVLVFLAMGTLTIVMNL
jgi:hypothetical protein